MADEGPVKEENGQSGQHGAEELREPIGEQQAEGKVARTEDGEGEADGRVQVSAGHRAGEVDGHGYAEGPDHRNLPEASLRPRQHSGGDHRGAHEHHQPGADGLSDAAVEEITPR